MRIATASLLALLLGSACSGASTDGGQTGSLGPEANECEAEGDCAERAAAEVEALTSPTEGSITFTGAECTSVGIVGGPSGPSCVCSIAGSDGSLNVGPVGLDCYRTGRGGDCLWAGDEFEGCDVTDASSCDAVCSELEQRLAEDAARTFDASVMHTACEDQLCHSVIEIEGRCYADRSYQAGRSYDCAMDPEAILEAEKAAQVPPKENERPQTRSSYVAGTSGMVQLVSSRRFAGSYAYPAAFGAMAQFANISGGGSDFGEIVDPLEGLDDCGIFIGSGSGVAGNIDFYDAADVQLLDAGASRPFELAGSSNGDYYSYILELESVEPRFGESYGVHVAGGEFGAAFDSASGLHLPQALDVPTLQATSHFEQADLDLTWTGSGDQPLYVSLIVNRTLTGFFESSELYCTLKDDGEFTIPGELLQKMPAGFASMNLSREDRRIIESGEHSLLLFGSVQVDHQFAIGPTCQNEGILEACQAMAASVIAEYEACEVPPPPTEELCPDFLATSCNVCPEYFECAAQQMRCTDQGLYSNAVGCVCPAQ